MKSENTTEGQPQVGSDAGLGVGALLMLSFGNGAEEATIEAQYEDRYLVRWKLYGCEIMNLGQLKSRHFIVLPPQPPRRSWWSRLFTPNEPAHRQTGAENSTEGTDS